MTLDPVVLSRIQFVWVIAWHILLPALTVGLASYVAMLEGLHVFTRKPVYLAVSKFWLRIFAVTFGMGVVSGIVMPFQFGTNWSRFTDATANVVGPLFAYEGLTAFFLEAAFLGVLLFGRKLVPPAAHFVAALMVAAGTLFSSFWIIAVNSWMQTPRGYSVIGGRFFPADWTAIIFSPSFPYRLAHTVTAFYITTGFVVLAVGAYTFRTGRFINEARVMIGMALGFLALMVPLQVVLGDQHGLNTLKYQPAKLAAIEGLWETGSGVPAVLFALPNQQAERNDAEIAIPRLGSLYLTHDLNGRVEGLKDFPRANRPPVWIVFFAFRLMVGVGLAMFGIVALGWFLRWRGRLYTSAWYLRLVQWTGPIGFVGVLAGWTTTEVGRQPWTVYGLLRTSDSVTPSLHGIDVLISLLLYAAVYLIVYPTSLLFLKRIVEAGPGESGPADESPIASGVPRQPVLALPAGEPQ